VEVHVTSSGRLGMSYSTDEGQSWTGLLNTDPGGTDLFANSIDPANAGLATPFAQVTNPTAAIDRSGNVYVTCVERNAGSPSGALVLQKFTFPGATPTQTISNKALQRWLNNGGLNDIIQNPVVAVDDNLASFTDPATNTVQTDTLAGKAVYVAW